VRHEEGAALAAAGQAKLTSRRHGTAVQASHGTAYPTGFACRGAARQTAVISLSRPTYSASAFPPRERCDPDRACVPPDDPPARSGPSLVPISDARAKYETTPPSGAAGRAPVGWPGPLPGPCGESTPGGGRGPGTRGPRPAGSPTAHLLRRLRKARAMSPALTFRKRRSTVTLLGKIGVKSTHWWWN
jgi:hypothetical protein